MAKYKMWQSSPQLLIFFRFNPFLAPIKGPPLSKVIISFHFHAKKQSGLCRGRKQRKKKKEDGGGGGPPTDKSSKEGPKKSGETTEPEQATPTKQGSSKSRMGSSIKAKKKSVNKKRGGWKTKSPEVVKESSKEKSKTEKSVKSRKKEKEKKQSDENGQLHPACSQLPPEPPREPASLKAFPLRAVTEVFEQSTRTISEKLYDQIWILICYFCVGVFIILKAL